MIVNWNLQESCATCEVPAGSPCQDKRNGRALARPHRGRDRITIDPAAPWSLWLVEQHVMDCGYGPESVDFHATVRARTAQEAYLAAERQARGTGEDFAFAFLASELEEVTPGYLWEAADGSSIGYQVRKLASEPAPAPVTEADALQLARGWVAVRKEVRALLITAARRDNTDAPWSAELRKLYNYPSDLSEDRLLKLIASGDRDRPVLENLA